MPSDRLGSCYARTHQRRRPATSTIASTHRITRLMIVQPEATAKGRLEPLAIDTAGAIECAMEPGDDPATRQRLGLAFTPRSSSKSPRAKRDHPRALAARKPKLHAIEAMHAPATSASFLSNGATQVKILDSKIVDFGDRRRKSDQLRVVASNRNLNSVSKAIFQKMRREESSTFACCANHYQVEVRSSRL